MSRTTHEEQRRFKRVTFSTEDGLIGCFSLSNTEIFNGSILNLSAGGLHFVLAKKKSPHLKAGDIIRLIEITGVVNFDFFSGTQLEIVWLTDLKFLQNIGIGCRFLNLDPHACRTLDTFVNAERKTRKQFD
jgi:c-di-GMP-binding flagellar brake protein YcgR